MPEVTIITNNVPRLVIDAWDLSEKEMAEFDYLDTVDKRMEATFFRYKGQLYDVNDIPSINPNHFGADIWEGWDGRIDDSFCSGILVKWPNENDFDRVIVGRYYC